MKRFKSLLVMLVLVLLALPLHAQDLPFKLAVVQLGALYELKTLPADESSVYGAMTLIHEQVPNNPAHDFRAVWSPDGTKLAYTAEQSLMVWDGTQSVTVASGIVFMYEIPLD